MEFGLKGKTAIVTGGASNIGHGIVMAFAKEGANVVIADIDEPQGKKTAGLAEKFGVKALFVKTDVTKPEQCQAMAKKTLDTFGRIDVLSANAGGTRGHFMFARELPLETAQFVMDLNFWGAFHCARAVVDHMIARKSGKIVITSSGAGLGGNARYPLYSAAKAAVISLTKSLALELAPHGINVNTVAPGQIRPDQREEQVGELSAHYAPTGEHKESMFRSEAGSPADIANMTVFLASDAAGFISGQVMCVTKTQFGR